MYVCMYACMHACIQAEMYPECVIASWGALILLLDAENIERRVQLDTQKKIECLCKLQTPGKNSVTQYVSGKQFLSTD